jgi:hypothetical protein
MTETERVARALTECTLPKAEWTHHAHLRAGLWHVVTYGEAEAAALLRERISRYNESVGTVNSDSSGYHETLTVFYVKVIAAFVAADAGGDLDAMAERLIARQGDRKLPLRHYSRALLFSVEARRAWVEPDVKRLGT